ncbi:MAG: DNA primase [Oligoflexia bacterium]|nr:DNA primase [Oligoflexia bacterium]
MKRRVSGELLQKIKAAVNILEVVGEHVVLRKSGANYSGLCPFHSERTPSFSVSEQKQLYHCYGCRKGGDLVSFVMELHGLDFREALEELAERARIALPNDWDGGADPNEDPEARRRREEAREKQATAFKLNRFVAHFFHQQLAESPTVQRYLRQRGLTDELVRSFYLGAAPAGWEALAGYLAVKKAPLPLAAELGVIRPSVKNQGPNTTGYFDLFRNRAIFPIIDLRGKVAGFGGRALPGGDENPKYLNSPESFVFHKSKLAFGLYQAQKHIREKDEVILVEGYFDVLAMHAAGFQNVIASCGTALTPEHLAIFRRFAGRVTVLFDGDRAGIAATGRAMELGLEHGTVIQGAAMPEGLDPDEVLFDQETGTPVPEGRERMAAILKEAKPLIDVRIEDAIRTSSEGPEARTQALKQIGSWLARYTDPVGREVRAQHVQSRMGITRELMESAMGRSSSVQSRQQSQLSPQPAKPRIGLAVTARPVTPHSAGSRGSSPAQDQRPANRKSRPARSELHPAEKVLLAALVRGGEWEAHFRKAQGELPPGATIADLFDYPLARELVSEILLNSKELDSDPLKALPAGAQSVLDHAATRGEAARESSYSPMLTEAMVASQVSFESADLKRAIGRGTGRCWARFSQRIKEALAAAEAKKDAELQQKLMKEYLDVQRKMKEFTSFYDEE